MRKWQAIVFDLDDTLYPEYDYVLSGFRAIAEWIAPKINVPSHQVFAELQGLYNAGVRGTTFNQWLDQRELNIEEWLDALITVYREHVPSLTPFPEVPALLDTFRRGYQIGLISDGYLEVQKKKFEALGLASFFDVVIYSDQWGRTAWKPSRKPYEAVLEKLSVSAAKAIYVGDNPTKDFIGAREVGLFTVWCCRQTGEYDRLMPPTKAHAADLTINSLAQLEALLQAPESL